MHEKLPTLLWGPKIILTKLIMFYSHCYTFHAELQDGVAGIIGTQTFIFYAPIMTGLNYRIARIIAS